MTNYEVNDKQPEVEDYASTKPLSIVRADTGPTTVNLQLRFQLPSESIFKKHAKLLVYALATLCGLIGNSIWQFDRDFDSGALWLWLAFFIWLGCRSL